MPDLAVIIVTWNVRELALDALRSLFDDLDANGPSAQVYVVDSASIDGTAESIAAAFPQVKLISCRDNIGFVRANNLALHEIGFTGGTRPNLPRAVYLLNPDTVTQPGATRALYDALMADPAAGLVGAQLSYGDGSFQHSAFTFPGLRQLWTEFFWVPGRLIEAPFNGRYQRARYDAGQPFAVDCVLGATMMLKREVIELTGVFDETFFMYCEEIDWAWRIRKAGWTVKCVPAARVVHLGGQSTQQARPASLRHLWTSRLRLYKKHFPAWKAALARWLVAKGMRWRMSDARRLPPQERAAMLSVYRDIYRRARRR
jgi:N-acetylglucosaminyl-diphospho-decaprenol L-rhamnosyltransferase